jgi:hypothetical protein
MRRALILCALMAPIVAIAGVRVSSHKGDERSVWDAAAAIDDDPDTAWMIDPESEQKGEWIEIDLPKSEVDKLGFMVGFEKDDESWSDHGRIKTVRLELFSETSDGQEKVYETSLSLEDKKGMQVVDIEDKAVGNEIFGGKARITITDFTAGDDYPSVAVSEIRVILKEFDAAVTLVGDPPPGAEGEDVAELTDDNPRTAWVSADPNPSMTVHAVDYGLSSLVITPGPKTHARPKTIEVTASGKTRTFTLEDNGKAQAFPLITTFGYTGSFWDVVQVTVKDSYPGSKDGVGIAEIDLKATSYGL